MFARTDAILGHCVFIFEHISKHILMWEWKCCFPFHWIWVVSRSAVYTGSETYWRGLCLFMSLPLTTSVLTQRQEMIDTAKRCNVRRGGGGWEEKKSQWEIPNQLFYSVHHFCASTGSHSIPGVKTPPDSVARDRQALFLENIQRLDCLRLSPHAFQRN